MEDTKQTKEEKIVITKKDQDELVELLQTYKTAILGHEDRIQALERAVITMHEALTQEAKKKLVVPKMTIPKER